MGGNNEHLKSFDLNNNKQVGDEKDLELFISAIEKKESREKGEYIKQFNYELESEDKNNLLSVIDKKIKSGEISEENIKYLKLAKMWVENPAFVLNAQKFDKKHKQNTEKQQELNNYSIEREKQAEKEKIEGNYLKIDNINRILEKIKNINPELVKKISDTYEKINYFNVNGSDFDIDIDNSVQEDITKKFQTTLREIEKSIDLNGKISKEDLVIINDISNNIPEIEITKFGTASHIVVSTVSTIVGSGEKNINETSKDFKNFDISFLKEINISKIGETLMSISLDDFKKVLNSIVDFMIEKGNIIGKKINSEISNIPDFLGDKMHGLKLYDIFIKKIIPVLMSLISPGKILKILKPLQNIKGISKIINKGNKIKSKVLSTKVLPKVEKISTKFLNKLSKLTPKQLADKIKEPGWLERLITPDMVQEEKESISSFLIKMGKKINDNRDAYNRLEGYLNNHGYALISNNEESGA